MLKATARKIPDERVSSEKLDELALRNVLTTDRLRTEQLIDLAEGRRLAIRIPGYYSEYLCSEIATKVDVDPELSDYENAPIARIGKAFYEVVGGGMSMLEQYYEGVVERMDYIRSIFGDFVSPLDRFCRELDERWTHGAKTLAIDGRKMNVGLFRNFKAGSEAEPHQDVLLWDAPHQAPATFVTAQLAWNLYARTSSAGGELELWDMRFSKSEYESRRRPGSYGLLRESVPPPTVTIAPQTGEMILFNASLLHAVRPTEGVSRITITCFVGYRGRNRSLVMWS